MLDVRRHVAMRQHRAFRNPGGPAGVLNEGGVRARNFSRDVLVPRADFDRIPKGDGVLNAILRDELLEAAHGPVDYRATWKAQHVAELADNDEAHVDTPQNLFNDVSEVRQHDDAYGARVLELMFELARCVEGIRIHDREAYTQCSEQCDWILEDIRQHERDTIAWSQPRALQIRREVSRTSLQLLIGQCCAETME